MFTDLLGKRRYVLNLHTHTTISDGQRDPAEVKRLYRDAGYDAIALTDHWRYGAEHMDESGLLVLSGVEYNIIGTTTREGLFHIVGVGLAHDPALERSASAQEAIDAIRGAGGLAVIAHPAWSLNTPAQIMALERADATEIYNTVSDKHMSRRPDSSLIVDMLGAMGRFYPLIAADDAHYYDGDQCFARIMVEAEACTRDALLPAIRRGDFYATEGPEVHLFREGDAFRVLCSPVSEIVFFSDAVWSQRVFAGEGITEAVYTPRPEETFVRAAVKDANGLSAWTNCIRI